MGLGACIGRPVGLFFEEKHEDLLLGHPELYVYPLGFRGLSLIHPKPVKP